MLAPLVSLLLQIEPFLILGSSYNMFALVLLLDLLLFICVGGIFNNKILL